MTNLFSYYAHNCNGIIVKISDPLPEFEFIHSGVYIYTDYVKRVANVMLTCFAFGLVDRMISDWRSNEEELSSDDYENILYDILHPKYVYDCQNILIDFYKSWVKKNGGNMDNATIM